MPQTEVGRHGYSTELDYTICVSVANKSIFASLGPDAKQSGRFHPFKKNDAGNLSPAPF